MPEENNIQKDKIFIEFLHKTKEYFLVLATVFAAIKYLSQYIDEISKGIPYLNWVIYVVIAAIIFSLYFFTIRPAIIKRRELNMKPTGEPDEQYFTTSPRIDDKFHFFSLGYESYLEWLRNPQAPVLYLTGQSGSGKSSLINAYLAPQLEKAKSSKTNVYSLRSYHKPLHFLYNALAIEKKSDVIINEETVINEIKKNTSLLSKNERILIVLDQFEEFFLLRNKPGNTNKTAEDEQEDTGDIEELKRFFQYFINNPVDKVCILLSYRDDFQQLIDRLELPARIEHINFEQVKLLSFDQASKFLRNCPGIVIPERRLNSILNEAASIDTPVALRPIVLNLLGIILKRMVGQSVLSKKEGNLIRQYIINCLGKELKPERATVLKAMLTDFNTARPRSIKELSKNSKLSVSQLDNQMLSMQQNGLVRCLDLEEPQQDKRKWQVAHDFVALQLEKVVFGISKTIWQKGKPWIAPVLTSVLIMASSFLLSGKEYAKKKRAQINIEKAGFKWHETSKTISADGKPVTDSMFRSVLDELIILQPDSLFIRFSDYVAGSTYLNIEGINRVKSLKKMSIIDARFLIRLEGLKGLTSLTDLDLSGCLSLQTIESLEELKALTNLNLRKCRNLQNIEQLRELKTLTNLNLDHCDSLQSIEALRELKGLTYLDLRFCRSLQSIEALRELKALTYLNLGGYLRLQTIEPLRELKTLTYLDLNDCDSLQSIEPLRELRTLTNLNLSYCDRLQTIEPLKELKALNILDLSNCDNLQTIEPLRELKALTYLNLFGCGRLQTIEPLRELKALTYLDLFGCRRLQTIEPLRELKALTDLTLNSDNLQTIEPLRELRTLTNLNLSYCDRLQTIEPLRELRALTNLNLFHCDSLQTIEPLRELKALTYLNLSYCLDLKNLDELKHLTNLQYLDLRGCGKINEAQIDELRKTLPKLKIESSKTDIL